MGPVVARARGVKRRNSLEDERSGGREARGGSSGEDERSDGLLRLILSSFLLCCALRCDAEDGESSLFFASFFLFLSFFLSFFLPLSCADHQLTLPTPPSQALTAGSDTPTSTGKSLAPRSARTLHAACRTSTRASRQSCTAISSQPTSCSWPPSPPRSRILARARKLWPKVSSEETFFLSLCLSLFLSTYLFIYVYLSTYLSVYLSLSLSFFLPIYLSLSLSLSCFSFFTHPLLLSPLSHLYLSIDLHLSLSFFLYTFKSIYLSIYLPPTSPSLSPLTPPPLQARKKERAS